MKIAILSDVHGNKFALEAVLEDIQKEKVDHIILLGDLVTDLPNDTNSVLNTVKLVGNTVIRGNREYLFLNNLEPIDYDQFKTTHLTSKIITEENHNYLNSLPEQVSLYYDSKFSIRCVHGSP